MRTKPHGPHHTNRLSAQFVRGAPPGLRCDGNGLNLRVDPNGARRWLQRLVIHGKPRTLGLGGYPLVSLAEAREKAFANRKLARAGGDPLAEKRLSQGRPTFEEAAAETIAIHRSGWRSTTHEVQWRYLLQTHAFPHIGSCRIDDITCADVLAILNPIWHTKPETARRVRQHIGAVMKWAIAQGHRPDNPAGEVIGQVLGRQPEIRHHRALPYKEVAAAIRTVRESEASEVSKLAFEFLVLTAARSGEVRLARWNEMDLVEHLWTIPAERMKMAREHRVPLSGCALEILDRARVRTSGTGLLFPNPWGQPFAASTLSHLLKKLGIGAVPHGFRSSFDGWAAERSNASREVIDLALAHVERNKTRAAYARSDLFERRRILMDDWAAYLDSEKANRPAGSNDRPSS